jgi:predicted anti-sigma-YlaC factor YlaD
MNSCDGYRQALSARLDGEDPGMAEDALKAHLFSCTDCRAWVDAAERLSTYEVVANASALHPAALTELPDEGLPRSRPHGVMGWRVALIVTAALQLGVTWPVSSPMMVTPPSSSRPVTSGLPWAS